MTELYAIVTGPLAWVAFGIFIIGSVYRFVSMLALAKAKDGSSLAYMSWYFGLRSILAWMVPFKSMGWKSDPLATVTTFVFHIGFLLVAVFLSAHAVLWDTNFGISIPSLPTYVGDIVSFVVIATCAVFAYRRLALPPRQGCHSLPGLVCSDPRCAAVHHRRTGLPPGRSGSPDDHPACGLCRAYAGTDPVHPSEPRTVRPLHQGVHGFGIRRCPQCQRLVSQTNSNARYE